MVVCTVTFDLSEYLDFVITIKAFEKIVSMRTLWLVMFFITLIWSGIGPKDYLTWVLEVLPAVVGLVILVVTRRTFPLTRLTYTLILFHCIILMVGGHYTYAEVPLFDWIRDWLDLERNNYDKVGHFVPK